MSRPFRHHHPALAADMIFRDRVQQALSRRFERRVTAVIAGAGFGKTTALVQAFEENRLRPLGRDVWLACEHHDDDPQHLADGLAVAFGLDEVVPADEVVQKIAEWVGAASPSPVCLVLDDVHLVEGERSLALVADLIESLPRNGHVVLSARARPEVALSRLELIGECLTIGEDDLRLTAEQIAAIVGTDGSSTADSFGGWPALVQLARRGRPERRFVVEEVLGLLGVDDVAVLRALVALGEADGAVLSELTGVDAPAVLDHVPMIHRRGERWAAHDLWNDLLGADLDADDTCRGAAEIALAQGRAGDAVEILTRLGTPWDPPTSALADRVLRDALVDPDRVPPPTLRRWHERLPASDLPAVVLLRGLVLRLDNPGSDECHHTLRSAAEAFQREGHDDAAIAALGALVYAYHVRRDVDGLISTFAALGVLAEAGVPSAQPYPLVAGALVATSQGNPTDVVRFTDELGAMTLPTELRAVTLWLRANALANLGRDATEPASECYRLGLPLPGMAAIHFGARWRAGRVRALLAEPTQGVDGERDRFLLATWECSLFALLGDLDEARQRLAIVASSTADESQWQTTASVAIPRAVVAVVEGRVDDARQLVREFVDLTPTDGPGRLYYLFAIGLIYPLLPELRPWFDSLEGRADFGPHFVRDLHLTRAITALMDDGDLDPCRTVDLPGGAGELIPSLGLQHGALVLSACVQLERDVDELLGDFADLVGERGRAEFRRIALDPDSPVAGGAAEILESMPIAPAGGLDLAVLGGTELVRSGRVVDEPDWRRERVRALLTFLVLNPDTTREAVMAALWPDADAAGGRRNLRSTLNVLNSVLEPDRHGGDAPYFVRSSGQRLRLVLDDELRVDVIGFEQLVDEARRHEDAGTPSRSIDPYLAALRLYRGDLLPDSYDDWVVFARDRLRSKYITTAVRAAELLIATGRPDEAVDVASPALAIEPWSEPAHRALIAAHLARNDLAAAHRCMESCDRALADLGGPIEDATAMLRRRLAHRA